MKLLIELAPGLETRLRERAAAAGKDRLTFAREVLEHAAQGGKSLAEILGPIRRDIQQSGMSEAEFDALIEGAIADSGGYRRRNA